MYSVCIQMYSVLYLNVCLKWILKGKVAFIKSLTAMDSGCAELETWPPKIFHTFTDTLGKELISERNKKLQIIEPSSCMFSPITSQKSDLTTIFTPCCFVRCNRLLFPQKRDLAHRAPSAFQIPELQLAPGLKVYALSTFVLSETGCGTWRSCKLQSITAHSALSKFLVLTAVSFSV